MSHISIDPRIKATIEHLEAESHQAVAHIEQAKKDSNDYDFEETFEKTITPYGNGAKINSQKKFIGKKAIVIILKESD